MRLDNTAFEWDEGNESELARHRITLQEVEEVFFNEPVWASNRRGRAGNRVMIGRTDGGRALTIIVRVELSTETIRAITGWESTRGERTRYAR